MSSSRGSAGRRPRLRRLALLLLVPPLAMVVWAACLPLPRELADKKRRESTQYLDREGGTLREVRADDASRARWVPLDEMGERVPKAMLAAEDRHFEAHPGVDPWAALRAVGSNVTRGRVVSGASTLTMQLARLVVPHPRSLWGKLGEMALALRIEASLSKKEILEEYLNRAPFGPGVRGIEAASRFYLDKPARELSWAEAAALAAIPRGPAVYSMTRHPERVVRRRDRILDRMLDAGWIAREDVDRAKAEPLVARPGTGGFGAPHLVQAIESGAFGPRPAGPVRTTIDARVQREVEAALAAALPPLADRHVTAASAVVIDNASGEVLAYVGSHDWFDAKHGGQNDGVRARRQPGSTLKPFVYGLAMEELGLTPASVLPDVELKIPLENGVYAPMNYDERFHGPVRMREALGSSLNVPAVWAADSVGVERVLLRLREAGFDLKEDASYYGPGIALGDGEVSLLELTAAYAAIARGGVYRAPSVFPALQNVERRIMPRVVAEALADMMADRSARLHAFGRASALDFSFDVAAKTGTSKGFRDNWTVGFTREATVGVWVGKVDGSPMREVSGVTGAAPLFHAAMESAMRARTRTSLDREDLVPVKVCPLSGGLATHACPHAVEERLPRGHAPLAVCGMHERVKIDPRNGLRAGKGCAHAVERTFERFDGPYAAWARAARREIAPREYSPLCPASSEERGRGDVRIAAPHDGARYLIDPDRARALQAIDVRVESSAERVTLRVGGRAVRLAPPFVYRWTLEPGEHVMIAEADGRPSSAPVRVIVE